METLVKKRAVIKTQLTLFEKYLDSAKLLVDSQSDLTQQKISELEIRLENSRTLLDKFNDVQLEIELLVSNDAELTSQILERETFENKYYKSVVSATAIISSSVKSLSCNEGAAGTSTPTYALLNLAIIELAFFVRTVFNVLVPRNDYDLTFLSRRGFTDKKLFEEFQQILEDKSNGEELSDSSEEDYVPSCQERSSYDFYSSYEEVEASQSDDRETKKTNMRSNNKRVVNIPKPDFPMQPFQKIP
ncbi:hypothetical protein RN001_003517 [Aquatica leii]|uniref:Uncharacterized protein n=1 Tax=Aquatica leii TaxID=1421715 RepID=A0AAN7PNT6_9COLE|nr:hypothetical protein RN001_003517 [Aquatica leii]